MDNKDPNEPASIGMRRFLILLLSQPIMGLPIAIPTKVIEQALAATSLEKSCDCTKKEIPHNPPKASVGAVIINPYRATHQFCLERITSFKQALKHIPSYAGCGLFSFLSLIKTQANTAKTRPITPKSRISSRQGNQSKATDTNT